MIRKYQEFIGKSSINENVAQAKSFLKKRALNLKKEQTKKEDEKLTPDEERKAENDPNFLKIKELTKDNAGYTGMFTKFFYNEEIPFEELVNMLKRIKEYRQFLATLPTPIDRYGDIVPDENDKRGGFERLNDDLTQIELGRITKKFVDRLPGDFVVTGEHRDRGTKVDSIKKAYQYAPDAVKEKVAGIAKAFDDFGKESNGTIDIKKNKELQDYFFSKIKRYRNLNDVITGALAYIKSAGNASISKFFQTIAQANAKYGERNGADVVYDENNVLILEIKSFQTNKELNANTSHCIASSNNYWESYVGSDSKYNKQYYIYNFNLAPSDDQSVIGITISSDGSVYACHTKSDRDFKSGIKAFMRNLNISFDILAPMSKEEVEIKKKRVIANKEIIRSNLSLEDCKKYVEEGADPNAQQGKPLTNAVAEDDLERVKYLLDMGAAPNIGSAIKEAKNLEMIKTLVSAGAELTSNIFEKVAGEYEAVKYLVDAGMNVNFDNGLPLRSAAKHNNMKTMELLIRSGANIEQRRFMVVKWAAEWGRVDILNYLLDKLREKRGDKYIYKPVVTEKAAKDWLNWTHTSDKLKDENKKEVYKILNDVYTNVTNGETYVRKRRGE